MPLGFSSALVVMLAAQDSGRVTVHEDVREGRKYAVTAPASGEMPPPIPLSLHQAEEMDAGALAELLLDGVEHRRIVDKSLLTDPYGKLTHVWLTEAGRASGPSQCARTTYRLKFDKGQLFHRSLDHALALGTTCEAPANWIRLQMGASPEVGARLLKELTSAQARIRQGAQPRLQIECIDRTKQARCSADPASQFAQMDIATLGAIERSYLEGYRFKAWWPVGISEIAWSLHYQPVRDADDRLLIQAAWPAHGTPPPPPPPQTTR